ncbi:anaerobic sulfatase maturase [Vibrio sp. E150_011]
MEKNLACHVMAKPSGSICNIDCKYCFYLEKDKLYPERNENWRMSDDTLELFIQQYIETQPGQQVQFAWQGGEPTLLGIDFYRKVVELAERYRQGKEIHHAFQTNGILLNDEWCQFFKEHQFLVGVSIDGPEDLHDQYRVTRSEKGTHRKVMESIECLKKHKVEFNTLAVINAHNAKHPLRVYQFLKQIGSNYLQFIPLVERKVCQSTSIRDALASPGEPMATMTEWSVSAQQYGSFLNKIFDYWIQHDVGKTFVQTFDSTLASWLGQPSGVCISSETCGHAFALEANGDLYQCDHYVYPEYQLGNIHDTPIRIMNQSEEAIAFGQDKHDKLNRDCKQCTYRFACHGGCPKHRFERSPNGLPNHNYLCEGYYAFFKHTQKPMSMMADLLRHQRPAAEVMHYMAKEKQRAHSVGKTESIGRNALCPCGSDKKFKRCCG